jgi:hypothetical protein
MISLKGDSNIKKGVIKLPEDKKEPTMAPGIDDNEELNQDASSQERQKGEYTNVTTLILDEADPS